MSLVSAKKQFDDTVYLFVDSNDQSLVPGAVQLLLKIVENIISHPDDPKFRKIKTNSKLLNDKILSLKNGEVLLFQTGFVKENDEYVLHPDEFLYNYLIYIKQKLEKFIDKINGLDKESEKISSSNDKPIIPDSQSILAMQQILQFIHQSSHENTNLNSHEEK